MKGDTKCQKWGGLGVVSIGRSVLLEIASLFGAPLRSDPFRIFSRPLRQKTGFPGLCFVWRCFRDATFSRLVYIQCGFMTVRRTDRQTDGHTSTCTYHASIANMRSRRKLWIVSGLVKCKFRLKCSQSCIHRQNAAESALDFSVAVFIASLRTTLIKSTDVTVWLTETAYRI